ncbi:MAG: 2-aminoethylphosphonate--pyruvate transaminase [Polyangia bacterium]
MTAHRPEPLLFTPGPLTTSPTVKAAMLRDLGSRDAAFLRIVAAVRSELLRLAETDEPEYTTVPMQGSGTFALEATLGSVVPPSGRLLVLSNGTYGERLAAIATALGIPHEVRAFPDDEPLPPRALEALPRGVSHVAMVHCETSTGVLNPVGALAAEGRARGLSLIVDAMSSFGAVPTPVAAWGVDYLVTSANKCLEGVPGLSLVLLRRAALRQAELELGGRARSYSLDLGAQLRGLDRDGQFRFTPPTHAILALHQALHELREEGGPSGRAARYKQSHAALHEGARRLGLVPFLRPEHQSYTISAFYLPEDPRFDFRRFYDALKARGFLIYPGSPGSPGLPGEMGRRRRGACFRVGTIGRIDEADVRALLAAMAAALTELGVALPLSGTDAAAAP